MFDQNKNHFLSQEVPKGIEIIVIGGGHNAKDVLIELLSHNHPTMPIMIQPLPDTYSSDGLENLLQMKISETRELLTIIKDDYMETIIKPLLHPPQHIPTTIPVTHKKYDNKSKQHKTSHHTRKK